MSLFPGFGGAPSPPPPPPPPPPPLERTDPAVEASKKALAASEARRRGRQASLLTGRGSKAVGGELDRPSADGDKLG